MANMNGIIAELYQCREIAALVSKLPDFPDPMDVKQEAFIVLMAKDEAVIAGLHERGELKAFACKVISNTAKWTNGHLRTQMGKEVTMDVLPDVADTQEDQPAVPMDLKLILISLPIM